MTLSMTLSECRHVSQLPRCTRGARHFPLAVVWLHINVFIAPVPGISTGTTQYIAHKQPQGHTGAELVCRLWALELQVQENNENLYSGSAQDCQPRTHISRGTSNRQDQKTSRGSVRSDDGVPMQQRQLDKASPGLIASFVAHRMQRST